MKINITIGKLILIGYKYHDDRRITTTLEKELVSLIGKNGLPNDLVNENERKQINLSSFVDTVDMNHKSIGVCVGYSIYQILNDSFK